MATSFELAGHVVGVMLDQDVTSEYLKEVHGFILEKLQNNDKINLFCEIMPGNDVPVKSIFEDIIFKYQHAGQISRLAFVTDIQWLRGLMVLEDLVVGTQVKTYESSERLEAINWISQ